MAVVETQPVKDVHPRERAVFVTDDDRRARRLRRGAFVTSALACLWLVGLGVGMFGFGSLPGVSLVKPGDRSSGHSRAQAGRDALPSSAVDRAAVSRQAGLVAARRAEIARRAQARRRARSVRARTPSVPTVPVVLPAPPAQQPFNPAENQRGWARRGQPAPPGQVRKAQPAPPPGSRGQRRGQTTTTTLPPPLPPGQAKKTQPPPPPEG